MNRDVIDVWGDVGSSAYWRDLRVEKGRSVVPFEHVYVPLRKRWPQPGFIGEGYFDSNVRILVVGQNPRASNNAASIRGDKEMFELIKHHSAERSAGSLERLFRMMRGLLSGDGYGAPWPWVEDVVNNNFHLNLDKIAYLNLIPLATHGDNFTLATYKHTYDRSTRLQLHLLEPDKILFHGKAPYDRFQKWEQGNLDWDTSYLERIYGNVKYDPGRFAEVRKWLRN